MRHVRHVHRDDLMNPARLTQTVLTIWLVRDSQLTDRPYSVFSMMQASASLEAFGS